MKLWYEKPAEGWTETLPVGNGNLGAMIWGNPWKEVLGLNEESLWSGYEKDKNNPQAKEYLNKVRELLFAGKPAEAEKCVEEHLLGEYNESYLPLGNLEISLVPQGEVENYRRSLDLDTGVVSVEYGTKQGKWKHDVFASYPAQAIIIRITGSSPVSRVEIGLNSQLQVEQNAQEEQLSFWGQCPEHIDPNYIPTRPENFVQGSKGMKFSGQVKVLYSDGKMGEQKDALVIHDVKELVLAVGAVRPSKEGKKSYEELLEEHLQDYQKLMNASSLYLGEEPDLPTDERLNRMIQGKKDPALYALYYQYGRYLFIASSREGSLPANLQGIWSWELRAPWSSNWTTNINTQMNYWHAQITNLGACMEPYFRFMERICEKGKETAQVNYGCRGFVHHHNADYWNNTNPVGIPYGETKGQEGSSSWSMWPMGGNWVISELFKHYEYHLDREFLKETAYPILKEAAAFCVDWLVPYKGYYVTCPSTSPENRYISPKGDNCCLTIASTMDLTLIHEVFRDFRRTCEILGIQDELLKEIEEKESKMQPYQIGEDGRLYEWYEQFEEPEPGHRHVSHLYGLFPSDIFRKDEKLVNAARKSLEYRLSHGGGYTGWSCAWIINLFAILRNGEKAQEYLHTLLTRSTYPNMWDAHPPFQIDGNFGGTSGIAYMLLQSEDEVMDILPALSPEWEKGEVKGLCGKGQTTIDICWDKEWTEVTLHTGKIPFTGIIRKGEKEYSVQVEENQEMKLKF